MKKRKEGRKLVKKRGRTSFKFVQFKRAYYMGKRRHRLPRHRLRRKNDNLVELDRISVLPDELVVSILSLLPLKEAAATSILSRRWRYVWASTRTLDFDVQFDVGSAYWNFNQLDPQVQHQQSLRYINWVNHVVEHHRAPTIEKFTLAFHLDARFTSSIDKWIEFAMNKRVQILDFKFFVTRTDAYQFPHKLLGLGENSALNPKQLHSEFPSLRPCGYSNNFGVKFLKDLRFQSVQLTGQVLEHFLYNCPLLERLSVFGSKQNMGNLRVVGPSIALKYLSIGCCKLESIEIRDTKLVSFVHEGVATNLLVSNVPLLVEVSLSEWHLRCMNKRSIELSFTKISCCLSQLEILILNINLAVYNPDYVFPALANLKHLELLVAANYELDLFHLNSFMKASPYLQRLVLKLISRPWLEKKEIKKVAECPHNYLKVVEIIGYRTRTCVIQHVMYLIKSAVALEKIVIDPVRRWLFTSGVDRDIEEAEAEVKARDHAMQHLQEKVPSTIEFVCL